ncbi:MAG TPA: PLDc N-terminal domain-containing protein [Verrucomicrobiae bacterium]|jgi:hypothetical protein|nr:PLDc N-terminal domain-containing protein [Verrucomicrobiae bacterium]
MFTLPVFGALFFLPVGIFGILALVFWVWMLIDAIQNPSLSGSQRIVWVLVILFLNLLGALIYLLAGRRS